MNKPNQKFIVLSSGRTGSNLLRSLLNSHPDIVCDAELFLGNERFDSNHDPYRHIETSMLLNGHKKAYGFVLSLFQVSQMKTVSSASQFLSAMQSDGWKIINLYRSHVVRQALSFLKARETKLYHLPPEKELTYQRVEVSFVDVFKAIYALKYYRKREERMLEVIPHISIDYTRDLRQPEMHQQTVNAICRYLNVDIAIVSTHSIRLSGNRVSEDFVHGRSLVLCANLFSWLVTPVVKISEAIHYYTA